MAANCIFPDVAEICLCYGCAQSNARELRSLYDEQFPGRFIPDARMFNSIHRILTQVADNPTRTMEIVAVEGVSQSIVRRVHWHCLYPYNWQGIEGLRHDDYAQIMNFCSWLLQQPTVDRGFSRLWFLLMSRDSLGPVL
jgi:hypothetical protein